jgi:AraC-like DNA-binding protein
VHPRERLSYWRETAGAHEVELSADPGFLATLRNQMLNDLVVCELDCDPCQVKRTARNIARAGCDHFVLCMQLSGKGVASQGDRVAVNANGGFILLDASRPYEMSFEGRSVTLMVPRRALEERLGAAAALSALTMDAGRPLTGIASVFLSMLPSRIDAVDKLTASRLADQALDFIALALSLEAGQTATLASARATALFRLKAVIDARLCDPALKPATVAAAAGISVRYANDLLSEEGFSVARYILHRRLERCRRALEDPAQAGRMIGEIAFSWGFSDLSHFVRRFRAAYGMTPGDYRRRACEIASTGSLEDSQTTDR